jgi:predicted RNA-binding Zn-ribbon protein involved in translation (DUF1610 family)
MIRTNAHALNFLSSTPHERVIQFVMSKILCPKCGAEAVGGNRSWTDTKPYCPVCGWNLERVKASQQKNLKLAGTYLVVVAIAFAAVALFARHLAANAAFGVGAFSLFLLIAGVLSWRRLKTLESVHTNAALQVQTTSTHFPSKPARSADPSFDQLLLTRRPRPLKMKSTGYVFLTALVMALLGLAVPVVLFMRKGSFNLNSNGGVPNLLSFGVFGLILLIALIAIMRSVIRDRRLLSEGEIAIATVTSQSFTGGENKGSKIKYEFKDVAGKIYAGSATDQTRTLFEEMQTPVFYNPMKPAENVPLVAAMYKLAES